MIQPFHSDSQINSGVKDNSCALLVDSTIDFAFLSMGLVFCWWAKVDKVTGDT